MCRAACWWISGDDVDDDEGEEFSMVVGDEGHSRSGRGDWCCDWLVRSFLCEIILIIKTLLKLITINCAI